MKPPKEPAASAGDFSETTKSTLQSPGFPKAPLEFPFPPREAPLTEEA